MIVERFITEKTEKPYGLRIDNPGGDWLRRKIAYAEEGNNLTYFKGIVGSITAWMGGTNYPMRLPVSFLSIVPGARNEKRKPGDHQYDSLMRQVSDEGFDNSQDPILIGVNHLGRGYILEGNTRVAVAKALKIDSIFVEIRYFNGGEAIEGPYNPYDLGNLAKHYDFW